MDRDDGRGAISNLPDSVLLHILSFLPTRDPVRTVMVPGFRHLWTSTRHLSFDHCPYHNCQKFVNFTDHELTLHESPTIDSFRLNLNCASEVDPYRRRTWNKLDTWIRFAARRKVKFLDLDFLFSSLVELKLASCVVRPVAGLVQRRLLRKLFMKKIDFTDYKMTDILSGSPLLKELSLEDCYGIHKPKFCCGPSIEELNLERCGGLEKLDLTRSDIKHLNIDHYEDLELICPNMKILDIAGCLDYVKVTDTLSLVDTSLSFGDNKIFSPREYCEFRLLLEKLSCSTYFMPCDYLLRSSHFLETLTIYVYPGRDDNKAKLTETGRKLAFEFNGYSYWNSLKHVKIHGYVLEPDVIELIEFLLKSAQVQEKMEISTEKTLQRVGSKDMFSSDIGRPSKDYFVSFPRASTRAVLHLG
ncbi:hypothetical protein ACJRO7_015839 [Eucalyptus globulus]|uniref:At1g61320/AtMIF1 LRR domain-containing protein n=1 Tax=Eucalyptus globulus TaxID=34317 RepID=A0ABD3L512_EUCGL